ncbi:MAG: SIS domain-containing protein [Nibricoccus sp.]
MQTPNSAITTFEDFERAGASHTAREIAQQPGVWRELGPRTQVAQQFLAPLLARPDVQIVLCGAGTSAHIGACLAPALTRRWGARVRAIATTDLVADPRGCLNDAPLLLVSFARSGNSPESVAALKIADQVSSDCHHLIITCNAEGALSREGERSSRACVIQLPAQTNDRAFAMTSSFSCMLLAAALAFELVSPQGVDDIARWGDQMLADPSVEELSRSKYERVVYLGDRELGGLAREAALKLLELTDGRVVAISETPMAFRHGPKCFINERTLVIVLLSNDSYARAYEVDLLEELRRDGIAARVVTVAAGDIARSGEVTVPGARAASDLALCFPFAVFAQRLAMFASMALNLKPDSPNARGVVNRVVQGVTVYPWKAGQ